MQTVQASPQGRPNKYACTLDSHMGHHFVSSGVPETEGGKNKEWGKSKENQKNGQTHLGKEGREEGVERRNWGLLIEQGVWIWICYAAQQKLTVSSTCHSLSQACSGSALGARHLGCQRVSSFCLSHTQALKELIQIVSRKNEKIQHL